MDAAQQDYNAIATAASVAASAAAVSSTAGIMKELSEIKIAQAKNDTEIKNIGATTTEIKTDVKEIKALYVTRAELKTFINMVDDIDKDHEARIRWGEATIKYGLGFLGAVQVALVIYLTIHNK